MAIDEKTPRARSHHLLRCLGYSMVVCLTGIPGCSALDVAGGGPAAPRTEGWSQVILPDVSRAAAFDAGLYAMRQWFRIEESLPESGSIRSAAVEYDQKGGTGRVRDAAIGYTNRMRRSATLVVQESGGRCVARCVVHVERLDTADHRVFRDARRFDDYPTETPIDSEAGVSRSQDQVWTAMPRDRSLERDILNVLKSRVIEPETATAPS